MCLAKQLQQLMTCKCCCASSDSRKLHCNFLNSATTVSQTLVIMQKNLNLKTNIYLYPGNLQCLHWTFPWSWQTLAKTGFTILVTLHWRSSNPAPLLDKWLWPALYGSDQSKICLIERWIGLICRIKRAWQIRLVHRLTDCKTSTDRLFHRFVYGIIEATQHG